jgi:hypothetical protein
MIDSNKVKNASKFQNNMVTITLTSRALFWPTYMCKRQNISEPYWRLIKNVSQHGTNTCSSAYKKSVSSVRRREVTACFTSASFANRLPTNLFLKCLMRWKSFRPHTANQTWDWFQRYDCEVPHSHLFGPLQKGLTGKLLTTTADVKQAVTFWLQTLVALQRLLLEQDTSVGATVGQILKHQS